ncbi:MAG: RICIN domain-containing protein [Janthinobacterium lividum]
MAKFSNHSRWTVAIGLFLVTGAAQAQFKSGSYYRIISQISGRSLDIGGASVQNGAGLIQWDYAGSNNQQWQLVDAGGGYYKIVSRNSGQCLDVGGASLQSGASLLQWTDNGQDNQRWHIDALPNGGYTLTSKHSGLAMQPAGGSLANGAAIQQVTPQSCAATSAYVPQALSAAKGLASPSTATVAAATTGQLAAYPNPANDFVTVLLPDGARPTDPVAVYDALGRLVPHAPLDGTGRLAVSQLPGGTYSLAVGQGPQQLRKRLLVAHEGAAATGGAQGGLPAISATAPSLTTSAASSPSNLAVTAAVAGACIQGWQIDELGAAATPVTVPVVAAPTLTAYQQLAQSYSQAAGMTYRYGSPSTVADGGLPTQYKPNDTFYDNKGNGNGWYFQIGAVDYTKNDYSSNIGQVLHVADNSADAGVDAIQQLLMGAGMFSEKPQLPWVYYGGGHPDPEVGRYATANGAALRQPTAVGHSYGFEGWASNDLVAFQSGLIAAFGTNTSPGNVSVKLPANKVPTAVAITSNNEFGLVTVWDTNAQKGQVAVLALGTGNSFWGDWAEVYPGLRNRGLFTFIKLLGYVDLPAGVTQPTEISASTDFAASRDEYQGWMRSPDGNDGRYTEQKLTLTTEINRQSFVGGTNQNRYSKAGFAVVISKAEKKAVFLDLKPLFDQVRTMYFTTPANFNLTRNLGQQPAQWPFAFSVTPAAAPVVVKTVDLAQAPTAVRTSVVSGVNQAYVATQDGTLHLFSVGGYGTASGGTPSAVAEVGSVAVGANPTSIAYSKDKFYASGTLGNQLIVAVRGERAIKWVSLNGNSASVFKTLRDTRLKDPVWVEDNDNHGTQSSVVTVADYSGKQVSNYRYGPIIYYTNGGSSYGMGANGQAEFEFGGNYVVAGYPFQLAGTNTP